MDDDVKPSSSEDLIASLISEVQQLKQVSRADFFYQIFGDFEAHFKTGERALVYNMRGLLNWLLFNLKSSLLLPITFAIFFKI